MKKQKKLQLVRTRPRVRDLETSPCTSERLRDGRAVKCGKPGVSRRITGGLATVRATLCGQCAGLFTRRGLNVSVDFGGQGNVRIFEAG